VKSEKTKILLIGFEDCQYCQNAVSFVKSNGFNTTVCWASKDRKSTLPKILETWKGDYIFHLKSYNIIPKVTLENAKIGAINFHPSPPRYPGSGGLNFGLYNDDSITGVTVHYMNEKIDNGDIIDFYSIGIEKDDNIETLLSKVHKLQYFAFCDIIKKINNHGNSHIKSMCKNYTKEPWGLKTGRIRDVDALEVVPLDASKYELERLIRATSIGRFGPKIILHGKTFRLLKE